jgi:outer membrane protein assembly factor BamB
MHRLCKFLLPCHLFLFFWLKAYNKPIAWGEFRGPAGDGDAKHANLPVDFSETKNIAWKSPVEGKAWSSPVVKDNIIWVTTADIDGHELRAIQFDWDTGRKTKDVLVFAVEEPQYCHPLNSYATPTPVIANNLLFVHFGSHGTAALDFNTGEKIWERKDFICNHHRGPAASPIAHNDNVIIHFDGYDFQYIVCLDQNTGRTVWRKNRAFDYKTDNGDRKKAYCTPTVIKHMGREELISPGAIATESRNPLNGELYWTARTGGMNAAARPVYRHGHVFVLCGMGSIWAIRPGGKGWIDKSRISWTRRKVIPKKSSPLFVDNYLFLVSDEGVASCNNPLTGEILWAERLGVQGQCAASPIHANGKIYAFSSEGDVIIFLPCPKGLKVVNRNKLDHGFMASPAVFGDSLLVRTKKNLYRIDG